MQLSDKVIAVTGAASGIGLVTAKLLASRGARLSLADVVDEGLEKAKAEILSTTPGASVLTTVLDVRDFALVDSWIAKTVEHFGRLDGAANIAGVVPATIGSEAGRVENMNLDEWNFILAVNTTGVMHCMKAQLQKMGEGGSIVNASSIAGVIGRESNGSYTASKHAVIGLSRSAAKEVGKRGVRVNAICPLVHRQVVV